MTEINLLKILTYQKIFFSKEYPVSNNFTSFNEQPNNDYQINLLKDVILQKDKIINQQNDMIEDLQRQLSMAQKLQHSRKN